MRVGMRVLAMMLAVLMLAQPASAGSKADPEVVDRCDGQVQGENGSVQAVHESVDICSAWLSTPESGVLEVTLQTKGDLEDRPGGLYIVYWNSGSCIYGVTVDDAISAERPQSFSASCGEPTTYTCPVPDVHVGCESSGGGRDFTLPADSVTVNGNELRVTVRFTGALGEFLPDHDKDSVLSKARAWTSLVVGPVYAFTFGCSSNFDPEDFCFAANGDGTADGRDYTVPE